MSATTAETNREFIQLGDEDRIIKDGWAWMERIITFSDDHQQHERFIGRIARGPLAASEDTEKKERRKYHEIHEVTLIERDGQAKHSRHATIIFDLGAPHIEYEFEAIEVPPETSREEVLQQAKTAWLISPCLSVRKSLT